MIGRDGSASGDEGVGALLLEWASTFLVDVAFLGGIKKDCSLYFPKIDMDPSSNGNLLLQILAQNQRIGLTSKSRC